MRNIKEEINALAEADYQKFASSLLPGIEGIKGVRLPNLRKLAKQLAKEDWRTYMEEIEDDTFEEVLLKGMILGYAKADHIEHILPYIAVFVGKINNWSTCDSFCTGLKITMQYPDEMWNFIQPYLKADTEYEIRFGVVMGIYYYITDSYVQDYLGALNQITHSGYYVKMSVAWAISMIFVKYPEMVTSYLENCDLDDFTYNKTLQKITESHCVTAETKAVIREKKRKTIKSMA